MTDHDERDLTVDERNALRGLRVPIAPDPRYETDVLAVLRSRGVVRARVRPWLSISLLAASLVFCVGGGYALGVRAVSSPQDPQIASGPLYAFLLVGYAPPSAPPRTGAEMVAAYSDWAEPLRTAGRLVVARELDPRVLRVGARENESAVSGLITGLFIVNAPNDSAATLLASTLPHARTGGLVTVQLIRR